MMATQLWPICMLKIDVKFLYLYFNNDIPFNKARTKAIYRIGPHNIDVLSVLICGMLGDWWGDKLSNQSGFSVRFNIEQSISNSVCIHHLTTLYFNWGYSFYIIPKLVKKSDIKQNKEADLHPSLRFNYRLTLYTFSSLTWIYNSFYVNINGKNIKRVPHWIEEYIRPIELAHWIMQDGSRQIKQGVYIATHSFTYEECIYLSEILNRKHKLKSTVVKSGHLNQWRISLLKEPMPTLVSIVKPYIIEEMKYKFIGYI